MRPCERGNHFGQGAEVQMDQAADGMMVEVKVIFTRQRPERIRAIEGVGSRNQAPSA